MAHRVEQDVDPERVAVRRELLEEERVPILSLPGVGDIGVVRHQHQDPAMFVRDGPQMRHFAVNAAFGGGAAAPPPELDRGDLRYLVDERERAKHRVVEREVVDRVFTRGQHPADL